MGNGPMAPNPLNPTGVNWMPNWMGNHNNDNGGGGGIPNAGPGGDPGIGPFFNNSPNVFPGDRPFGSPGSGPTGNTGFGTTGNGPPHVFPGDGPYNGGPSPGLPPPSNNGGPSPGLPPVFPGDGPYNGGPQGPPPPQGNYPPYLPTAPGATPGAPPSNPEVTGGGMFGSGFNVGQVGQQPIGAGGDPYNTPITAPLNNSTLNQPQTAPTMSNKQPTPPNPFSFGGGG